MDSVVYHKTELNIIKVIVLYPGIPNDLTMDRVAESFLLDKKERLK